jgi:predicted GIY-YIG superfamily endonuclease/Pyruvate/2-oxoacid:ferredoxin oxidoreductase delta subunit
MPYYVYVVLCEDGSFYTGYTKNLDSRMKLHVSGNGARYTRMRKPRKLVYVEERNSISEAMKREKKIKRLSHQQKLNLIKDFKRQSAKPKARTTRTPTKNDWTREELEEQTSSMTAVTIPVRTFIRGKQRILDFAEVEKIIKEAKLIALGECYCRKKYKKCDGPIDVCLSLDKDAKTEIDKGLAKKASLNEAFEALRLSHEAGLVHIAYTFERNEKPELICSCCSCCCHSMSALVRFGMLDAVVASKYVSVDTPEACINCGKCIDRCQFKARQFESGKMSFDKTKCFGCGVCVSTCPTRAISLVERDL